MKEYDLEFASYKLNKVSPAFCLAKYDLFTLHLHLGAAHSCHLSELKKLDPENIKGPYDFFNFPEIRRVRKEMKDGIKSNECKYCWKIEQNSKYSDRHFQSIWGIVDTNRYDEFVNMNPLIDDVIPSYLEVSFSNLCNLKCTYCNCNFSSRWENDLKKYGDNYNHTYFNSKKPEINPIKKNNFFLERFFEYLPEIIKNLKILRITGGEPTIQKEFYQVLNYIENNPQPDLMLCINTNLCPSPKKFNEFIDLLKKINNKVKQIIIYTSCDTSGEHAEFIREGLNYSLWKQNCHTILKEVDNSNLNIMCTFNNLCLTQEFKTFINDIYDMTEHSINKKDIRTFFSIQPLANPIYQSIEILDYDIFENIINEIQDLLNSYEIKQKDGIIVSKGFLPVNIKKFNSIKNIIKNNNQIKNNLNNRKDFLYFLNQTKIRNNKDYSKIFNDNNYRRFFTRILREQEFKLPSLVINT